MKIKKGNEMKKVIGIVSVVSTVMASQGMAATNTALDGLRVGVQGGYVTTASKVKVKRVPQNRLNDTSDISGHGMIGGVMIDWGHFLNGSNFLMGLEASVNFSNATGKKSTNGTIPAAAPNQSPSLRTDVELQRAYDLTGKLGYRVGEVVLPYIKAGATLAHWKATSKSEHQNWKTASSSKNKTGFIGGVGVDFSIQERFSVGAEYSYRRYGNLTHTIKDENGDKLAEVKVKPSANVFMVRLNYKVM